MRHRKGGGRCLQTIAKAKGNQHLLQMFIVVPMPPYNNGRHLLLAARCCFQLSSVSSVTWKQIKVKSVNEKSTKCATKCAEDSIDKQLPGYLKKFKARIWMQGTQGMCLTKTSYLATCQSEFSCVYI